MEATYIVFGFCLFFKFYLIYSFISNYKLLLERLKHFHQYMQKEQEIHAERARNHRKIINELLFTIIDQV